VGHRSKRLVPGCAPLPDRIEGEVVESTAGDCAPNIETTDEAHRLRAQPRGRLTVDERPTRAKSRRKMMEETDTSWDRKAIIECGKTRRSRATTWNRDFPGIESPAADIESISREFDAAREATDTENTPQSSGLASCMLCRCEPSACLRDHRAPERCAHTRNT
jgi:hypothetical protein